MNYTTDCLIIGSGAAGLTLALGIADKAKVIVEKVPFIHGCIELL